MSIKVKYDQAFINLMGSIFYKSTTEEDEFVPIVKDMNKIPNIISFINSNNSLQMNLNNNISLVFFLKNSTTSSIPSPFFAEIGITVAFLFL